MYTKKKKRVKEPDPNRPNLFKHDSQLKSVDERLNSQQREIAKLKEKITRLESMVAQLSVSLNRKR